MNNNQILHENVLVLNATYEPINLCNVKRAIILVFKGTAVVLEKNHHKLSSAKKSFDVPSVIRLSKYIQIPFKKVELTRKNILIRDKNTCQYCGDIFPALELTIDHIIPKAKGGQTRWDNVVACCKVCNNKKGKMSSWEAGMPLIKKPSVPNYIYFLHIIRYFGNNHQEWMKYLFE